MSDDFSVPNGIEIFSPGGAETITPSDTDNLPRLTRGVYVGTSGDLRVLFNGNGNVAVIFRSLASGVIHPMQVKRVFSTGTTAANIVGVY